MWDTMMKKILLFAAVCNFLHAMDHVAPEVKIAWSYPLKIRDANPEERILTITSQIAKKKERGNVSSWIFNNKCYATLIAIPLDECGVEYSYSKFRARELACDFSQCLAVALIDRYQCYKRSTTIDRMWCLYSMNGFEHDQLIEVKLLKKLSKLNAEVSRVCIMPGGRRIMFILTDGTIAIISPDEVKTLPIKDTRCQKLADIFFRWR